MSMQSAIQFIRLVREDEALKGRIRSLGGGDETADLVALGAEAGLAFTAEDLQAAFRHDWRLRWLLFGGRHPYEAAIEDPSHGEGP